MADKKVGRSGRERPITLTQKMEAALSDPGTMNMAETTHAKGKSALVDKFREREEQWRREQAIHSQQAAHAADRMKTRIEEVAEEGEEAGTGGRTAEPADEGRGGGS